MDKSRGNSGAIISLTSKGVVKCDDPGRGIIDQAAMCDMLYPVTPKVLSTRSTRTTEYYTMETLKEPQHRQQPITNWVMTTLLDMRDMLTFGVWSYGVVGNNDWITSLRHWLPALPIKRRVKYERLLDELFVTHTLHGTWSRIHGDPTLANVLYRGEAMVICDPIPAKGKIPNHFTVDLGKMLQSALGWEEALLGWRYDHDLAALAVVEGYPTLTQARAWFWAAINCLRILPYARNTLISSWAADKAEVCIDTAEKLTCSMRSISTVHS